MDVKNQISFIINSLFLKGFNKTLGDLECLQNISINKKNVYLHIVLPSYAFFPYKSLIKDIEYILKIYKKTFVFNIDIGVNILPMSVNGIMKKKNAL